jgi:hypothetical protein
MPCANCGKILYVPVCPDCGTPAEAPTDAHVGPPPSPPPSPSPGGSPRPVRGWGCAAMAAVGLSMLLDLVGTLALVLLAFLLDRMSGAGRADVIGWYVTITNLASRAGEVIFVIAAVLVIIWLYRARRNLDAFGLPATMRAGWAIGGWFVPFVNLVVPVRVMLDVGRKSAIRRAGALTGIWWAAWLGSYVADALAFVDYSHFVYGTSAELAAPFWHIVQRMLPGTCLGLLAGLALIALISRISRAQQILISRGAARSESTGAVSSYPA